MGETLHNLPQRLSETRTLADLSQAELAKRLGVSTSLISHWEKGTRTPSGSQLIDLARHMGVALDYLLNSEIRPDFLKCRAKVVSEQRDKIDQVLRDASSQVHFVATAYRLAEKLPTPFALRADFGSMEALPSVASHLRETLKLNRRVTFDELKQALSDWNIFVFDWDMPHHLSGISLRGALSVIFVNHQHPPTRRLFTLAHEFAHVVFHLGREAEGDKLEAQVSITSTRDPIEKEANAFAGELLIPRSSLEKLIAQYMDQLRHPAMLDAAARHFNVSRDALFYRLTQVDFFSWTDKSRYFRGNYPLSDPPTLRVADPKGEDPKGIDSQVDARFRDTALTLYQEGKVTTSKLAEWFFTPRHIADEYLDELAKKKDDSLPGDANGEG